MGPLAGLRVIDLSPNRVGAQVSQLFADFGADVIQVEPPGGAVIRRHAAYPFWGRGKRSIVLDLGDDADREHLRGLARRADVFIETHQPGKLAALGLGYEDLAVDNPGLIYCSVTGFGTEGPYRDAPGYEGLVAAKFGLFKTFERMSPHDDPPFVNVPFASFAASQVAQQGILAALVERQHSGLGQHVETSLVKALSSLDTWAWFEQLIVDRWPDAFNKTAAYDEQGRPESALGLMLLVCLTEDGTWLQFASVAPRLFQAAMQALGLAWMFTDPEWEGLPVFGEDSDRRMAFWTKMLEAAHGKTLAEWEAIFEADPNVFAEQYRNGPVALEHPQLLHDGLTIEVDDAEVGPVRQPAELVRLAATPAEVGASAPTLDQHRSEVLSLLDVEAPTVQPVQSAPQGLPLDGVTIVELATMFAAPHATTMLSDLGAEVIKIEPLEGDRIRMVLPFPEAGGFKVMQGKKSLAVDLSTPKGVDAVRRLIDDADVVVQGYRAGAMAKLGLDYAQVSLRNADVIYVNAPGYGVDGPYGDKPAYAPSIGAATGIPLANVGPTVEESGDLTIEQIQDGARRLSAAAAMINAQADGFAALGVATAILLGLAVRERSGQGQEIFSSMLNTGTHAMSAQAVTYPGAPSEPAPGHDLRGLGALYRIYDTADGYVFLAAPTDAEWDRLAAALEPYGDLADDPRFAPETRDGNATALIEALGAIFATRSAAQWEADLLGRGIGCVALHTGSIESLLMSEDFGRASGLLVDVTHPVLDEHPRLAPYVSFSRSQTRALPGVLAGSHTDELLARAGYDDDAIAQARADNVVA